MADKCALHQVSRPDVKEVHKVLNAWGGMIVHFSGVPPGTSTGLNLQFPDDLKHVLAGNAQGGISCSTVRPGDTFEGPQRNSWGCIGVIARGRTPWSLVGVDAHDCGSRMEPDGLRWCVHADADLNLDEVVRSLDDRSATDCNEWVIRDFDVLGILLQPPLSAREFGQVASREQIVAAFAGSPWFTIRPDGIYVVAQNFKLERKASICELYPLPEVGGQAKELAL
jgi:hypothetical protein